ncbi:MAG: hypothetical protein CMO60_10815 [Verrucomicrobiales bacterium]|nr:hypothetical protein [Verrucomicrobiales bacterium]
MMRSARYSRNGFTLVELVLSMVIMGLLMGSIFKLADATVKSTRAMVDHQSEEITRDAFFTLMKRHFEELPGNCRMDLLPTSESEPFLSELTFQNAPVSFNWGGIPMSAEAMRIITVKDLDGLDIVIEYFDEPILDTDETLAERGIEPIASVVLLEGLSRFEWNVLDGRNLNVERDEWPYEWEVRNRLPTFIELTAQFGENGEVIRRMFWCPTKVSPVTRMRQLQNSARSSAQQNGANGGGATINPNPRPNPEGSRGGSASDRAKRPTGPPAGTGGAR